ncbi:hypothetical protein BDV38DRAFT_278055 [Aspergillus pseudotamarii]|uniref:Uncharacterized protein n=1 Tax=Aspergillus pseudotamarii TaxID=132259 RepID=A0A5N6T8A1_ASPPS|nr:uncharacterized protein BDV38DRAFT_278055 [Aspergillus pseudotamarii]KAE8142532.1 hypothetical protein BDV38DRAFT_278055 [Aspergillus pseudotamarii]
MVIVKPNNTRFNTYVHTSAKLNLNDGDHQVYRKSPRFSGIFPGVYFVVQVLVFSTQDDPYPPGVR